MIEDHKISSPTDEEKLSKLLFAVARKFPGESRFDTALRYIREREERSVCDTEKKSKS